MKMASGPASPMMFPLSRLAWRGGLALFVLAGATGAWMRFSFLYGFPAGLVFQNMRHAHSHLMYFGWTTPVIMGLLATRLAARHTSPLEQRMEKRFKIVLWAVLIFALLSYPPFLLYGYQSTPIGAARLPLGVMASSLNIFAWYGFAWLYWRLRRSLPADPSLRLWDAAVAFLLVASLGAWGRAGLVAVKSQDVFLNTALVHWFLDLFSNGWLILAVLGLAHEGAASGHPSRAGRITKLGTRLLWLGLPWTFLLGMPGSARQLAPPVLLWLAGLGGLAAAAGILLHLAVLRPGLSQPAWRLPLGLLALVAILIAGMSLPPLAAWGERLGLRVLYLHLMLLGTVSLGLFAAARQTWGQGFATPWREMSAAVLLLLASLLPLSGLWPGVLGGRWAVVLAAWVALGPVIIAIRELFPAPFAWLQTEYPFTCF